MKDPKTKYGWPPDRDVFEPFPPEIPWSTPIAELVNYWLHVEGDGNTTEMPLKLLAANYGWNLTLLELIPRLKSKAGKAPDVVLLVGRGTELRRGRGEGRYHVLKGIFELRP